MPENGDFAPLLAVDGISAGYGDIRAVFDVSFEVRRGEVVALLGRNGAGKTTTLRAAGGLNPLMAGRIRFSGRDLAGMPAYVRARSGLALVLDGKRIFRQLRVEDNLVLGAYGQRLRRTARAERLESIYERFPILGRRRSQTAGALSGGQQQMLAIGQALMSRPRLLLLDEPSGGLAPAISGVVFETIAQLAAEGLSVVLVDQAVEAVLGTADKIVIMDLGRVVARGTPEELGPASRLADAFFAARE